MSALHGQDQPTQQVPPVPQPAPPGTGSGGPTGPTGPAEDRRRSPVAVFVVIALLLGILAGLGAALLLRGEDEAAPTERDTAATSTTTIPGTPDTVSPQDPTGGGSTGGSTGGSGSGSGSAPTTQAPTTTAAPAPGPEVTSVSAPSTYACSEAPNQPSSGQLTLSWSTTGAQSVTVAIDSPGGAYANGLPASGSLTVPAPCKPDSNTYYVIARAADGSTSSSSTTTQGV